MCKLETYMAWNCTKLSCCTMPEAEEAFIVCLEISYLPSHMIYLYFQLSYKTKANASHRWQILKSFRECVERVDRIFEKLENFLASPLSSTFHSFSHSFELNLFHPLNFSPQFQPCFLKNSMQKSCADKFISLNLKVCVVPYEMWWEMKVEDFLERNSI